MIVYKTTNLVNGKFYIGQDSNNNPEYLGSGLLLKKAIEKYGRENFVKEIVEVCNTKEQLNEREIFWIEKTKAKNLGYNIADGGHGGNTYSEETRKRISELFKGREVSEQTIEKRKETRAKNPEKYKLTEGRKQSIGDFHRGKVISEEQKQKLSERMKAFDNYSPKFLEMQTRDKTGENGSMWGKTHSDETRKKMSDSHKDNPVRYWLGKKQSPESNEKRRIASSKHRHSTEYKQSMQGEGNPFYGCTHSEETKKKISDARRNKTPEQKLDRYVKFVISRTGVEPSDEQKNAKLEEYRGVS
jgi:group I intron endonuclease